MTTGPIQQWTPPPPPYPPAPRRGGLSTGTIIALIGGGLVFAVCAGACGLTLFINQNAREQAQQANSNSNHGDPATGIAPEITDPAQLLKDAQRRLEIKDFSGARAQAVKVSAFAPEAANARKLLARIDAAEAKDDKEREPALRERLKVSLRDAIANANPHLNFVGAQITSERGGFAIWATHDFFGQYSLSMGNDAKVLQSWIATHIDDLHKARIKKVGLKGGGYSGRSWLEIPNSK